jgi:hypothetical protein
MVNGINMKAKLIKENDFYYLLDGNKIIAEINGHPLKSITGKLSKQNCDELFEVVDVDKWVKEKVDNRFNETDGYHKVVYVEGLVEGFNKAMELNKDKVFTLEDIKKVIKLSREKDEYKFDGKDCEYKFQDKEIIQSLQQPTEIEVMIVMETISSGRIIIVDYSHINNPKIISEKPLGSKEQRPKLDSSGQLILKKI